MLWVWLVVALNRTRRCASIWRVGGWWWCGAAAGPGESDIDLFLGEVLGAEESDAVFDGGGGDTGVLEN
jgi:hypothetical protein